MLLPASARSAHHIKNLPRLNLPKTSCFSPGVKFSEKFLENEEFRQPTANPAEAYTGQHML